MSASPCKVCAIGGGVLLAVSNAWAWATSVDAGAVATEITVIGGAIIGVVTLAITAGVTAWSKARAEAWATQERIRIQVRAEEERQNAESYTGQIKRLTAKMEEGNRKLQEITEAGNQRVEDANRKLHDARDQAQADTLRREAQLRELKEELRAARREAHEAREELHGLREDLAKAHAENTRLMADIRRLQAVQGKAIVNNQQAIKEIVASQSSDEIPTVKPPPEADRG